MKQLLIQIHKNWAKIFWGTIIIFAIYGFYLQGQNHTPYANSDQETRDIP